MSSSNSNADSECRGRLTAVIGAGGAEEKKDDGPAPTRVGVDLGKLKKVKDREAELLAMLKSVREEKRAVLRSEPLRIGVVGFGRFGQFIARTFARHACRVVATSRSDYTDVAEGMGASYVPLSDPTSFVGEDLDVIVLAVSILSFERTVRNFVPHLEARARENKSLPLIVDVLSVKEHPREIMLDTLPEGCDVLCTHPMFGPDSGRYGWEGLNFVYERTRLGGVVHDPNCDDASAQPAAARTETSGSYVDGLERAERFLSIWEEEGCRMVPMSCRDHDEFAANSQFITHLMGRILGAQGLSPTPIDTKGFESVLKLVGTTTADSFDLFYGLYKYNRNSMETIRKLRYSMDDVVEKLMAMEKDEKDPSWMNQGLPKKISLEKFLMNSFPSEQSFASEEDKNTHSFPDSSKSPLQF